jgi:uncharacterized protein YeaO (DUF488 family)
VKTKSIYEPAEPGDGLRVLITRYYPRGVKKDRFDRWIRALSPSRELLSGYRSGEKDWDEFKGSFLSEMMADPESIEALSKMATLGRDNDVTLLCYEKAGLPCHRYVVQEVLTTPHLLRRYASATTPDPLRTRRLPKASSTRFYSRRKVGPKASK